MRGNNKRPAHRPQRYPGQAMTTLSIRLPLILKEKLARLSDGRVGEWVRERIEREKDLY